MSPSFLVNTVYVGHISDKVKFYFIPIDITLG